MMIKDIESLSDAEKLALVQAVQESVAANKAKQTTQEVGQYAKLVVDAIKKIKADLEERYAVISAEIASKSAAIRDGKDGLQGPKGEKGDTGLRGIDGAHGKDGRDGIDGIDGVNGNGVTDARIDFDGSLIISLSDGSEINAGEVVPFDVAEKIKVIGNGGGTSQYVLDAIDNLQAQIDAVSGGLVYKGAWNASTNTPSLASSTGTNGWYYVVSAAGSTNLDGVTDWQVGDWAIYNGTAWQKIDQTNLVTSVNGYTGAVTLTATDVGAVGSVASSDGSVTVTTVSGAVDLSVATAGSTTNVLVQVRNTTGSTLSKGTIVYMSGATGQIPTVTKAIATSDGSSAQTLGAITADLANNSNGYVTVIGLITNMDTSAYTDGAQLYLSGTVAGGYTTTKPYAPTHLVYVGIVEHAHPTHGKLFVKVQNGYELDELHNVSAQSPTTGQTIVYNSVTELWEKNTVSLTAGVNGTLPVANGGTNATTASGARTSLGLVIGTDVLAPNGSAASLTSFPTLNQNTTGTAASTPKLLSTNFTIEESGGKLLFKYGATTIASMSSTGVITSATNIVSNGTP